MHCAPHPHASPINRSVPRFAAFPHPSPPQYWDPSYASADNIQTRNRFSSLQIPALIISVSYRLMVFAFNTMCFLRNFRCSKLSQITTASEAEWYINHFHDLKYSAKLVVLSIEITRLFWELKILGPFSFSHHSVISQDVYLDTHIFLSDTTREHSNNNNDTLATRGVHFGAVMRHRCSRHNSRFTRVHRNVF